MSVISNKYENYLANFQESGSFSVSTYEDDPSGWVDSNGDSTFYQSPYIYFTTRFLCNNPENCYMYQTRPFFMRRILAPFNYLTQGPQNPSWLWNNIPFGTYTMHVNLYNVGSAFITFKNFFVPDSPATDAHWDTSIIIYSSSVIKNTSSIGNNTISNASVWNNCISTFCTVDLDGTPTLNITLRYLGKLQNPILDVCIMKVN